MRCSPVTNVLLYHALIENLFGSGLSGLGSLAVIFLVGLLMLLGSTAVAEEYTVFTDQEPADTQAETGAQYELDMKFRTDVDGWILAVRYWRGHSETGSHTGKIWSSGRAFLASAAYVDETASGWQQAELEQPLAVTANTTYVVSYNVNYSYVVTNQGLASSIVNGPIHSVADGNNGVFNATPNAGAAADGSTAAIMDPHLWDEIAQAYTDPLDTWTVGGFVGANTDGQHTVDLSSKTLVVDGDAGFGAWLQADQFTFTNGTLQIALTVGPAGTITTYIDGTSCGITLPPTATLNLLGNIHLVFRESPDDANSLYYGLRAEGDRLSELQALLDSGKITYDTSAIDNRRVSVLTEGGFTYVAVNSPMITEFVVTCDITGRTLFAISRDVTVKRRLLDGQRSFPPEDCGGTWGYEECCYAATVTDDELDELSDAWKTTSASFAALIRAVAYMSKKTSIRYTAASSASRWKCGFMQSIWRCGSVNASSTLCRGCAAASSTSTTAT